MRLLDDDPYLTLGVSPEAGDDQIRKAYRQLMRQHHTDLNHDGDGDVLAKINMAYEAIRNVSARDLYAKAVREQNVSPTDEQGASEETVEDWGDEEDWKVESPPAPSPRPRRDHRNIEWKDPVAESDLGPKTVSAWTEKMHVSYMRKLNRAHGVFMTVCLIILFGFVGLLIIGIIMVDSDIRLSAILNGVFAVVLTAALPCWLIFAKSRKNAAISLVFTGLVICLGLVTSSLSPLLLIALVPPAVLGFIRRRRHRYCELAKGKTLWEGYVDSQLSRGRPLTFILQSTWHFNGAKTNALIENTQSGARYSVWIWGRYRAGLWVHYDFVSQSVTQWVHTDCLTFWNILNDWGKKKVRKNASGRAPEPGV